MNSLPKFDDCQDEDETGEMPVSEFKSMSRALVQLEDADLDEWDRDFIEGLGKRFIRYGRRTMMSRAQTREFERIKETFL